MKCKDAEKLILTYYLDEQLVEGPRKQVEKHLAICEQCRKYELLTKKTVIEPFTNVERLNPPEGAWHGIKGKIEGEQQKFESPFAQFLSRIRSNLSIPKPAFAVAAMLIVFVILATMIKLPSRKNEKANINSEEQIDCMNYLIRVFNQDSMNGGNGFGTSIEEYFL